MTSRAYEITSKSPVIEIHKDVSPEVTHDAITLVKGCHRCLCMHVRTWLSKQDGVVLRASAENLNGSAYLIVSPDHGVQLAVLCGLSQIPAIFG